MTTNSDVKANPVQIGRAQLWLGDCREILPKLDSADHIISDPPYGLDFRGFNKRTRILNDGPVEFRRLLIRLAPLFAALEPRTLAMFTRWDVWRDVHNAFEHLFPPSTCMVWDKDDLGKGNLAHMGNGHELIYVSAPADFLMRVEGKRPQNIVRQKRLSSQVRQHPSEKPLAVMDYLVQALSVPEGIVLDPFMGSGTTGISALARGRSFIGIELDPSHFDAACKRIEQAQRQGDFFVEAA